MRLERLREELGFSDEEWKAVSPMVTKVMTLHRKTRDGRGPGRRGPGRRGPGGPEARGGREGRGGPEGRGGRGGGRGGWGGEEDPAAVALQEVVYAEDAKSTDIKAKLEAYRESRKKNEAALAAARKDLLSVLTTKQEAILVLRGMLD